MLNTHTCCLFILLVISFRDQFANLNEAKLSFCHFPLAGISIIIYARTGDIIWLKKICKTSEKSSLQYAKDLIHFQFTVNLETLIISSQKQQFFSIL